MNKKISPEELEKRTVESLWLHYFNRSLREQKIISEKRVSENDRVDCQKNRRRDARAQLKKKPKTT